MHTHLTASRSIPKDPAVSSWAVCLTASRFGLKDFAVPRVPEHGPFCARSEKLSCSQRLHAKGRSFCDLPSTLGVYAFHICPDEDLSRRLFARSSTGICLSRET